MANLTGPVLDNSQYISNYLSTGSSIHLDQNNRIEVGANGNAPTNFDATVRYLYDSNSWVGIDETSRGHFLAEIYHHEHRGTWFEWIPTFLSRFSLGFNKSVFVENREITGCEEALYNDAKTDESGKILATALADLIFLGDVDAAKALFKLFQNDPIFPKAVEQLQSIIVNTPPRNIVSPEEFGRYLKGIELFLDRCGSTLTKEETHKLADNLYQLSAQAILRDLRGPRLDILKISAGHLYDNADKVTDLLLKNSHTKEHLKDFQLINTVEKRRSEFSGPFSRKPLTRLVEGSRGLTEEQLRANPILSRGWDLLINMLKDDPVDAGLVSWLVKHHTPETLRLLQADGRKEIATYAMREVWADATLMTPLFTLIQTCTPSDEECKSYLKPLTVYFDDYFSKESLAVGFECHLQTDALSLTRVRDSLCPKYVEKVNTLYVNLNDETTRPKALETLVEQLDFAKRHGLQLAPIEICNLLLQYKGETPLKISKEEITRRRDEAIAQILASPVLIPSDVFTYSIHPHMSAAQIANMDPKKVVL